MSGIKQKIAITTPNPKKENYFASGFQQRDESGAAQTWMAIQ
jgi:hypothetical protein